MLRHENHGDKSAVLSMITLISNPNTNRLTQIFTMVMACFYCRWRKCT